jgi:hypothetical protein
MNVLDNRLPHQAVFVKQRMGLNFAKLDGFTHRPL